MSESGLKTPLPPALDEYVRQRAAEDLIADTNRNGHRFVDRDVVLATPNDQAFGQHIPPTTNPAPYYLISTNDDNEPKAIWTAQDEALRAMVDMESERTQEFGMLHNCRTLDETKALLMCGVDIDQRTAHGETALERKLRGVEWGEPESEEIALYLIDQGADLTISERGQHAVHLAITPKVLDTLLVHGASINQIDELGMIPLHNHHNVSIATLLLDRGANPNAKDQDGNTPLHYAADRETAALLLNHGADPSIQNHDGQSAEQYLAAEGSQDTQDIAKFLQATRLRHALGETASQSRPHDSDLATPDDALNRRSRGRCM